MADMTLKKQLMPVQDPDVRNKNFDEVALGYTEKAAKCESARCLNCLHKPCVKGCPVSINIPAFIKEVEQNNIEKAFQIIQESSSLPAICGRVCPQENQCEKECVRGIKGEPVGIGRLERFVADWHRNNNPQKPQKANSNNHKIAIIGSGPAGLTCAGDLAKKGYQVTIFEALHVAGGVLMYGIPEFRLPKSIVQSEIANLQDIGVNIEKNSVIGKSETIDELQAAGYESIFIGSGAGLPNFMNIEGENLKGVYSANEFLTRCNLMKAYQDTVDTPIQIATHAIIIGGGNVAMDAARCAKRLGVKTVSIIYRRSMEELPARKEEVEHAQEEGIQFHLLCNPLKIIEGESGWVKSIEIIKMQLSEPDESNRRRPKEIAGSNFIMDVDCVIMAIGTSPNPLIISATKNLKANLKGCLEVDKNNQTSKAGVFAGGDVVTGAATVIQAMGAGKKAAQAIHNFIQKK